MTPFIHSSVRIHPSAKVSPGAVVGEESIIGAGCILEPYAVIGPHTTLGTDNHVFSFAAIGGPAQDRRTAANAPYRLQIGSKNIFREGVTVSRGTAHGNGVTRIGNNGLFMAQSHVGHDCILGDRVTLANQVSLAGHVQVGSGVTCGGHSAIHQFVHIGDLAFIAANAMVSRDIPPFCMASGDRATLTGINTTGLRRNNLDDQSIRQIVRAYRTIFRMRHGLRTQRVRSLLDSPIPWVRAFATFISRSERGVARHRAPNPTGTTPLDSDETPSP